ncbi:MAG: hypothetical protein ABI675_05025 [Chitinophagaceae bacterium]
MKKLFKAPVNTDTETANHLQLTNYFGRTTAVYAFVLVAALLFTGCKKQDIPDAETEKQSISEKEMNGDMESFSGINHQRLGRRTFWELQQARAATAKYLNIRNAYRDGYEDIHVPVENMGDHFMKRRLVDGVFEIRKPELLVYSKDEHGRLKLGAVEYAVPIDLSPNAPPEGFTGKADVWERNEDFGLWLLHAWVWKKNPDGVFNPTNPSVHTH